jgi:hypothetical protein
MIQWMDNFSSYGITGSNLVMLDGLPYADINRGCVANPDGFSGNRCWDVYNGTNNNHLAGPRIVLSNPQKVVGVAFRVWVSSLPESNAQRNILFGTRTTTNTNQYNVVLEVNGAIGIYRGSVLMVSTIIPVIYPSSWNHLEIKFDQDTGEISIRKEGVPLLSATDLTPYTDNTVGIVQTTTRFFSTSAGQPNQYIRDLVIWDSTGTENNDFIGPCGVYTLRPDEDVQTGWDPSTGTFAYPLLSKSTPNDTTYITGIQSPLPDASIVSLTNLPDDIVSVRAVMSLVRAWKTDGGDAWLQTSIISGLDEDTGNDRNVTTTPTYFWDISEINPGTTDPWTPLEINDADLKINRTA